MYRFLETIRIENGVPCNLEGHFWRIKRTLGKNFDTFWTIFNAKAGIIVPEKFSTGIVKARMIYDEKHFKISFSQYEKRNISRLILIKNQGIMYNKKYSDRSKLDSLSTNLDTNTDFLLVTKGMITDTSYCNVALQMGNKWFTPSYPLLQGTQRKQLLNNGIILIKRIHVEDLQFYSAIKLFNAMITWDEAIELPISNIIKDLRPKRDA